MLNSAVSRTNMRVCRKSQSGRVGLAQLLRFLVVKLTYSDSNFRFDMSVVPVDSDALLVTDFVNLKIKPIQSFGCAHRDMMCVRVFIGVSARTCTSIYVCTVFLKKNTCLLIHATPIIYSLAKISSFSKTNGISVETALKPFMK
jgi:hypothetical protein